MTPTRAAYPSDVTDEVWSLVAPYLPPVTEPHAAMTRSVLYSLIADPSLVSCGLHRRKRRWPTRHDSAGRREKCALTADIFNSRTLLGTVEGGVESGYDSHKTREGSKLYLAIEKLRVFVALVVTTSTWKQQPIGGSCSCHDDSWTIDRARRWWQESSCSLFETDTCTRRGSSGRTACIPATLPRAA